MKSTSPTASTGAAEAQIMTPPPTSPSDDTLSEEQLEFNALAEDKKRNRLKFLIERSIVYTSILSERLKNQQEEKQRAAAKSDSRTSPRKKQQPPVTHNLREHVSDTSAAVPLAKRSQRMKKKPESYSIVDVLSDTELDGAKDTAQALKDVAAKDEKEDGPATHTTTFRQPSLITGGVLKDFQLAGVEWLVSLYENGLNGILADEMGLGKTLQTIAFIAFLREKGIYGPFLVVAPLSTLRNWTNEFLRFAPTIPTLMYHGVPEERAAMRSKYLFQTKNSKYPVIVTSYNIILNDSAYLRKIKWNYIIIDEGHRIKNMNCKLIQELKSYSSANRLLLTGTPLQNNLAELWSLLNFLLPDIFHDLSLFQSWFDFSALQRANGTQEILDEENKHQIVSNLHAILKPFLLRRLKADVDLSLPPKREYVLYAPLTTAQQELYRHLVLHNVKDYLVGKILEAHGVKHEAATNNPRPKRQKTKQSYKESERDTIETRVSRRRKATRQSYAEITDTEYFKILENPESLVDRVADVSDDEEEKKVRQLLTANRVVKAKKLQNLIMQLRLACDSPLLFYTPWEDPDSLFTEPDESIVNDSGKMLLLDRLLPALFNQNHKVLVFSQFSKMLDLIQDYAELLRNWKVCRLDGNVKQDDRQIQIDNFNTDPEYMLFLISTRAGGLGINLTSADTVILFDSDWNPQQDLQAMDRAHRIGQTKPVLVYRFATANTIEQNLLDKADAKRQLEKLVIQKGKFKSLIGPASATSEEELSKLLLDNDNLQKFTVKDRGDVILSDEELKVLLDRSHGAFERAKTGTEKVKGASSEIISYIHCFVDYV
ncbi:SNF2 family N-terminal domain-containing protein [Limtongia smithiae]|uniref:SNF2 family N-terminal domain-containing protein n=1 Tax=Limtongia smithiae TaxID=1125753 RepID=UPI0034CF5206